MNNPVYRQFIFVTARGPSICLPKDQSKSSIPQSVVRKVHSLFQCEFSKQWDLVLPLSIYCILSFPEDHPAAVYVILFLFFLSLLSFLPSFLQYHVCIALFTLDAELLARSLYPEGPATGHLDTGFSWFPCVYRQMLRWFPTFQVATTCFSCSPPDLNQNLSLTSFIFCLHVK